MEQDTQSTEVEKTIEEISEQLKKLDIDSATRILRTLNNEFTQLGIEWNCKGMKRHAKQEDKK